MGVPENNLYGDMGQVVSSEEEQQQIQDMSKKPQKGFVAQNTILIILLVVLVAISGGLGFLYYREKNKSASPTEAASEESKRIKEAVAKHILLPEEEPAIATIIDVEKLKQENSEFYANAENGDKLLVYSNRAILYDPDKDLILNVAPIFKPVEGVDSKNPTPTATVTATPESTED